MNSVTLVAVRFTRHRDVNTDRLGRFLVSLGLAPRTIRDVKRGRPTILEVEWSDVIVRKLSELGHHEKLTS